MYQLGFIGTGVMSGAMLEAILAKRFVQPGEILVYDKNPAMSGRFGVKIAESASEVAAQCEIIQLGVKPQDLDALLRGLDLDEKLVISIAAGVMLDKLPARGVRLVPNINAAIGQSITAYCATEQVTQEELAWVKRYCECFGKAVAIEEKHASAFFVLAGSAPAFVYLFIDELARAGVAAGLPKSLALEIAAQTALGSAAMIQQTQAHPYELVDRVCSPGGITIAGINALREHGFAHAVSQAVLAAWHRDRALGK